MRLIDPATLVGTLTQGNPDVLKWLGLKRSVWVIGDASDGDAWKSAIAGLIGVHPTEILTVALTLLPSEPIAASSAPMPDPALGG
jgi:hypothetical protein